MTLAVLIPYRPDTPHRARIYETTSRLWAQAGVEVVYSDDGLAGLFSYARAANRARRQTTADCLLTYSVDALPLPADSLARIEKDLSGGLPWTAVFAGQQRFTAEQTDHLLAGEKPEAVGPPAGETAMGREALLGVRTDVWDYLRGYDERFVGWGPEDVAFHHVLRVLYPDGCDEPAEGLFQSLWHPPTSRAAWPDLWQLWRRYQRYTLPERMRAFYLGRP